MRFILMAAAVLGATTPAFATPQEFCAGFAYGFKSIDGQRVDQSERSAVPACPVTDAGLDDATGFQNGVSAGIDAAQSPPATTLTQ